MSNDPTQGIHSGRPDDVARGTLQALIKKYGKGPLQCVELKTGKVKWSKDGYGPGNVILAGDNLLALSDIGELAVVAATPSAYKELGRRKVITGKCWSTPVISDGKVFARSTKEAVCLKTSGR